MSVSESDAERAERYCQWWEEAARDALRWRRRFELLSDAVDEWAEAREAERTTEDDRWKAAYLWATKEQCPARCYPPMDIGYDPGRCNGKLGHTGAHYADFAFWRDELNPVAEQ